jgi:2-polyprenyl-3-methyl-5-hydroxy-6-metoxy-1,4-benzoquinol methylase
MAVERYRIKNLSILTILLIWSRSYTANWEFQSVKKWDQEWKSGSWDYMEKVAVERSKNAIIGNVFINMYAKSTNASVLDIGCGEGAVSDFLPSDQRKNYVGVDVSKEAIQKAKEKRQNQPYGSKFVHSSVYDFLPRHNFDVIVFSDVLYYVDHEKILQIYSEYLNPDGIIIISIFSKSMGNLLYENIFNVARRLFTKIDEIDIGGFTKKSENAKLEKTAFHIEIYRKKMKG